MVNSSSIISQAFLRILFNCSVSFLLVTQMHFHICALNDYLLTNSLTSSAGANLNEPSSPNFSNWSSIFSDLLFSRHPSKQRPSFSGHALSTKFICMGPLWALYVAVSSLTLPVRQRIRRFTIDKALSGAPLHRDMAILPRPPGRGVSGWSAPAPLIVQRSL